MLNIIVVGMGPIGLSAARAVSEDKQMKLVGLVDIDPSKLGKTLDDLDTKGKDPGGAVVTSSISCFSLSTPVIVPSSSTPISIFPPRVLAKAIISFAIFVKFENRRLNST